MTTLTSPTTPPEPAGTPRRQRPGADSADRRRSTVYNEQATLERSIRRLHAFLGGLPFDWRIVIADNASTDGTPVIARALAIELPDISVLRLEAKGRGERSGPPGRPVTPTSSATWTSISRPICARSCRSYRVSSRGTARWRSEPGWPRVSRVVRGNKREFISRSYNRLLRLVLRARFSDAQCGFKALRADAAQALLPEIEDEGWFFDTELLIRAQRRGLRIHEVAVDWIDDPDSRVDIVSTALTDLRGMARLRLEVPVTRFLLIGVLSTLAYAALYLILRGALGATARQRARAGPDRGRQHPGQPSVHVRAPRSGRPGAPARRRAFVYLLALGLTGGALDVLGRLDRHPSRLLEVTVLVVASAFATVSRYVALRSWVFARREGRLRVLRAVIR